MQKIEALRARLVSLQAEEQAAATRARAAASKATRAEHTRKMVLIGGTMQAMIRRAEWSEAELLAILDRYLQRADERELFGLAPLAATTPATALPDGSAVSAAGSASHAAKGAS